MCFGKKKPPRHLLIHDSYPKPQKHIGLLWLVIALSILLGSMMISIAANANVDMHEAESGQLLFQNQQGLFEPSLHVSSEADVEINGMIAHVQVSQTFSNQTDEWQEGVYIFPLPENSAVNHMEMRIGDRIIIGEIKEKKKARAIYLKAKREGKRAALTEQERPNIFSQRVANIAPHQEINVTISFIQNIHYELGEFSWRFPMTITPRFFPRSHAIDQNDIKKKFRF